jgi:phosphatidylinositol glycan class B
MKELLDSPFKKFFLLSLLCNLIASWFSLGYHQIDEHFMILEFASFKFGTVPASVVPWEFTEQIRPTLQPAFAYYVFSFLRTIGIDDAFVQVFLLRMLSCIAAWYVGCKTALRLAPRLESEQPRFWWLVSATCLWFVPYLQVRFSSENFAGITFLAALLCVPGVYNKSVYRESGGRWILAGLLLGLSFYFRFQMAFAIAGLLVWIALYARPLVKVYLLLLTGAAIAVSLNLLVDHWFYDAWVLTPYNYFHANIVRGAASSYGTTPWYDYIVLFATQGIPPISWVLLLLFFTGLVKRPVQVMVFALVPFLLGHMVVGHKEFRFLYPVFLPFLFICFSGLQSIWDSIAGKKWLRPVLSVLVAVNMLLLCYRCLWPAKTNHLYYKFLYEYGKGKPLHLITIGRSIYDEGHNEIYLYRPAGFSEDTLSEEQFQTYLLRQQPDSALVMSYQAVLPSENSAYEAKRLYVYLPAWIMNIQLNDWQSRSDIWSVWLLRKKH